MALNSLFCADVPLSNYSLTRPLSCRHPIVRLFLDRLSAIDQQIFCDILALFCDFMHPSMAAL